MKKFPKNLEEAKEYHYLVAGFKVCVYDVIVYCNHLFKPVGEAGSYEAERIRLHQKLFDFAGKDRIKNRNSPYQPDEFSKGLDSLICDCFLCPVCQMSLDRDNKCFKCDYGVKTNKELFNTIITNTAKLIYF